MTIDDDGIVLTLGEALIALAPSAPVPLEDARQLAPLVGGAELNFAIVLRRLGVAVAWLGRVGSDPFGRLVLRTLQREGVSTRWVRSCLDRMTGVYFREWLPDGQRRAHYYRAESAGATLSPDDWPHEVPVRIRWLHLTGITAALGPGPHALLKRAVAWASSRGVPISFDPNYREALWTKLRAKPALLELARHSRVLLMSEGESQLLFGPGSIESALACAHTLGVPIAVVKLAERGAVGSEIGDRSGPIYAAPATPAAVVDPVGAGDGFDAGFVAALLAGGALVQALEVANLIGARAVEHLGEHPYPPGDARGYLAQATGTAPEAAQVVTPANEERQ